MDTSEDSIKRLDSLYDRLILHFQANKRAVLVVEGEADRELLADVIEDREIFVAGTRSTVIQTGEQLHASRNCWVVCVFDLDFDDDPRQASSARGHFYPYEGRDLEHMLIDQGALTALLRFKGSSEKLEAAGGAQAIVELAKEAVQPVARLRQWSRDNGVGCTFVEGRIRSKTDKQSLVLEIDRYVSVLLSDYEGDKSLTARTLKSAAHGKATLPRGKDVLEVAGAALRAKVGSLPDAACDQEILLRELHASGRFELEKSTWLEALARQLQEADAGRVCSG